MKPYLIRIRNNLAASLVSHPVTLILHIIWVPLLLSVWGASAYGQWVLYSSVAGFAYLADLGFSMVSATEMCALVSRGKQEEALRVFESVFIFTLFPYVVFAAVLAGFYPQAVAVLLCEHVLFCLKTGQLHDVYRSEGMLARGTLWNNGLRMGEATLVGMIAWSGGGLLEAAVGQVVLRSLGFLFMAWDLHSRFAWFRPRFGSARWEIFRRLLRPSLAYQLLPLADQANGNALSVLIGSTLGPQALANFSTLRTLANACAQPASFVRNSVWPELSALLARRDYPESALLYRRVYQVSFLLTLGCIAILAGCGQWLYSLWTHQQWVFDASVFGGLLLAVFFNMLWQAVALPAFATNRHPFLSGARVVVSLFFLGGMAWGIPSWGLEAGSWGLAASEGAMLLVAAVGARQEPSQLRLRGFLGLR